MKHGIVKALAICAAALALAGCGSDGDDDGSSASPFEGTWSGTYSGSDNGSWSFTVDSNGTVPGTVWGDQTLTLSGSVSDSGAISADIGIPGTDDAASFQGQMDEENGTVTGTWTSAPLNQSGTFSGTRQ